MERRGFILMLGLMLATLGSVLTLEQPYGHLDWMAQAQPYETPVPTLQPTATATPTLGPPPRITLFRATPATLIEGGSFLLEWQSMNAVQS